MCVVLIIVDSLLVYKWLIVCLGSCVGRLVVSSVLCVRLWLFLLVWLV